PRMKRRPSILAHVVVLATAACSRKPSSSLSPAVSVGDATPSAPASTFDASGFLARFDEEREADARLSLAEVLKLPPGRMILELDLRLSRKAYVKPLSPTENAIVVVVLLDAE